MLIEVLTFTAGTDDEAELLAADAALQEELMINALGLVRRTTARGPAGWLVVTIWGDAASADAAASSAGPASGRFAALATPGSTLVERYETLD